MSRATRNNKYHDRNGQANGTVKSYKKNGNNNLVDFESLPPFLKDNEYLKTQCRPQLGSLSDCCKSMFQWHTETCNIWTHFLGMYNFFSSCG